MNNLERRVKFDLWTLNCWTAGGINGATFYSPDLSISFGARRDDLIKAAIPADWLSSNGLSEIPGAQIPGWLKTGDDGSLPAPFVVGV